MLERGAVILGKKQQNRGSLPETVAELVALGDGLIAGPKGYYALGAFNKDERRMALDLLGFDQQFVFSTFSAPIAFDPKADLDIRYGATRAHNRAMAEFCSDDPRLIGVALLPLDEPEKSIREIDFAISEGLGAVWVPHRPAGGGSPGHNDLDPCVHALSRNPISVACRRQSATNQTRLDEYRSTNSDRLDRR